MRRLLLFAALASFATSAFSKEAFIPVAGSVGAFRTDARIFNPSATNDITIQAYYLPSGNGDNGAAQPVTFTVPHRQMVIYNDVVSSLLHASGLGGIRFTSTDDYSVTERAYATTSANSCSASGTLGLSVEAYSSSEAMTAGVLLQLTTKPSFYTNIGAINTTNNTANVTWRLYDKNNAVVATSTRTMPPYAVVAPTRMTSFFNAGAADITDAWVNFTSDQPIVAYASINDEVTTDPTYIPMLPDPGASSVTPPASTEKTFNVTLRSSQITITPAITSDTLKSGDKVIFRITNTTTDGAIHGFTLVSPKGAVLVPDRFYNPGAAAVDQSWTVPSQGTFTFFCTNNSCSTGHTSMAGTFDVGQPSETDPGGKY